MTPLLRGLVAAASIAWLPAPVSLTGSVHDLTGAPIAGAVVTLEPGRRSLTTATDALGGFAFPDAVLPAVVDVRAAGFSPVRRVVASSPVDLTLAPASVADSVVVTADRSSIWRDPASGATVLSHEDLQALPAVTTDEALRVVSGFSLFRRSSARSANPTTHGVTLRGLSASGASRGLVLFDGVPVDDGFGGWVTWTRIPPLAVQRIDVDRGAEGDAFGSDALGGVIHIVPPGPGAPAAAAVVSAGSRGTGSVDAAGSRRIGQVFAFGAASWFTTDGAIPVAPESRGLVDRATDADWISAFARMDQTAGSRHLSISGWGGRDERGNGTVLQRNRMRGGTGVVSFDAVGSHSTLAARVSFAPNRFDQTFSAVPGNRATEFLTSTQRIQTETTRGVVEASRSFSRAYLLVRGGVTRARADFDNTRSTGTESLALRDDTEAVAAHAGLTPASTLTMTAGVRREWRAAPAAGAARDRAAVGHVGVAWTPASRVSIRGSVATSHRWPTLNELVRGFQVGSILTLPNADLKPERAISADAMLALEGSRWNLAVAGFSTVVHDAIANVTIPSLDFTGTVRERRNAGETRSRGLELDGEARPDARVRLRASATVVRARFAGSEEPALEGNRLPQIPRATFVLDADVRLPYGLSAAAVWRASSSQFDDDRNEYELASASSVDVRVTGRLWTFEWALDVENATNARVEVGRTPLVTLAPPRGVRFMLRWER